VSVVFHHAQQATNLFVYVGNIVHFHVETFHSWLFLLAGCGRLGELISKRGIVMLIFEWTFAWFVFFFMLRSVWVRLICLSMVVFGHGIFF
jgi:hypothetical protein